MSELVHITADLTQAELVKALAIHDFKGLTDQGRLAWVGGVCKATGVNPLGKVIDWITLQGKLVPYANKSFTDQLRQIRGISIEIVSTSHEEGVYAVTVKATDKDGRVDTDVGAVSLPEGTKGEARAMAVMKATTKAKRRVTLSMGGMGFIPMDESEVEDARAFVENTAPVTPTRDLNSIVSPDAEKPVEVIDVPPEAVKSAPLSAPDPSKPEDVLYWSDHTLLADGLSEAQIAAAMHGFCKKYKAANLTVADVETRRKWIEAVVTGVVTKFYGKK
jgi:hypothetical protein